jgi:hypothetical protein
MWNVLLPLQPVLHLRSHCPGPQVGWGRVGLKCIQNQKPVSPSFSSPSSISPKTGGVLVVAIFERSLWPLFLSIYRVVYFFSVSLSSFLPQEDLARPAAGAATRRPG